MATAKEIEEILGISSRTIETWSRTRDEKYLLAKYLKSHSKIELRDRLKKIMEEDNILIKKRRDFISDVADNFQKLLPGVYTQITTESTYLKTTTKYRSALLLRDYETLYAIEVFPLIPSIMNLLERCNKFMAGIKPIENLNNIGKIKFVFITNSGAPKNITKNNGFLKEHEVLMLNFDDVAEKLYDQKIIIIG